MVWNVLSTVCGGDQNPQIVPVDLVELGKGQGIGTGAGFNGVAGTAELFDKPVLVAGIAGIGGWLG